MGNGGPFGFEGQAGGFGEAGVVGDDPDPPAGEAGFECFTKACIDPVEQFLVADPSAIGWVADDQAGWAVGAFDVGRVEVLEGDEVANPGPFGIGLCHADGTGVAVGAVEMLGWLVRMNAHPTVVPCVRVECGEAFKGEMAGPTGVQASRDFGGFDKERARAAHRVKHRFTAGVAAFTQKEAGEGFAHGGLADRLLMPAFVQAFAGCIDADRDAVVVDAGLDGDGRVGADLVALCLERRFNPLGRRPGVVDLGFAVGADLDPEGYVGAQGVAPWEFACPFIELSEVEGHEAADARKDAGRPARGQVRLPDIGPCACGGDATGGDLCVGEAIFERLCQ